LEDFQHSVNHSKLQGKQAKHQEQHAYLNKTSTVGLEFFQETIRVDFSRLMASSLITYSKGVKINEKNSPGHDRCKRDAIRA
jgi:hypothetical protein